MRPVWWSLAVPFYIVGAVPQSPDQVAVLACQSAARTRVREQWPGADNVTFAPGPGVTQLNKWGWEVRGAGSYVGGSPPARRGFSFYCTHNARSGSTRVRVDARNGPR
jgi:hypothetical protein